MEVEFYKTHAYGNDYLLVDCVYKNAVDPEDYAVLARTMCRRRTGVGASGVVFLTRGTERPVRILCFNSRGVQITSRFDPILCASRYLFDAGLADKEHIPLETPEKITDVQVIDSNNFRMSLGQPMELGTGNPLIEEPDREYTVKLNVDDKNCVFTPMYLGNPFLVHVSGETDELPINRAGRAIRTAYPQYGNAIPVDVFVVSKDELEAASVRLTSRIDSLGIAASAAVAAVLHNFSEREVSVRYHGSQIFVQWLKRDNSVYITGTGKYIFSGIFYMEETEVS